MKPYLKLQSFGAECYTVGPSHDIDEGPAKGPYPRSTSLFSPSIILKNLQVKSLIRHYFALVL
jgi:hypothetical protein